MRGSRNLTSAEDLNITLRNSLKPELESADLDFRCVLSGETAAEHLPHPTPVCTTLAFALIIAALQWVEYQAPTPPLLSLETYCILDNQNNQYGTASIWLDQTVDPEAVIISARQGSLNCNKDILDPQIFNCSGSALQPGQPVTISVCNVPQLKYCPPRSARSFNTSTRPPILADMVSYSRFNVRPRMLLFSGTVACLHRRTANARWGAIRPPITVSQSASLPTDQTARVYSARQPARQAWSSTKGNSAATILPL